LIILGILAWGGEIIPTESSSIPTESSSIPTELSSIPE
jgi:hypothetical protein